MRVSIDEYEKLFNSEFPFLFGGTFIEGIEWGFITQSGRWDFPSFSEGLSLRERDGRWLVSKVDSFPFLFGGTFIEGALILASCQDAPEFPFLFGGTFIEGCSIWSETKDGVTFPFLFGGTFIEGACFSGLGAAAVMNFPSFSEGLSLRVAEHH